MGGINGRRVRMPNNASCPNKNSRDHFISHYANLINKYKSNKLKSLKEGILGVTKEKTPMVFYHVFEIDNLL